MCVPGNRLDIYSWLGSQAENTSNDKLRLHCEAIDFDYTWLFGPPHGHGTQRRRSARVRL